AMRADGERTDQFRVLIATGRSAVHSFFAGLREHDPTRIVISHTPVTLEALAQHAELVAQATTAVVDVTLDPAVALEVCQEMQRQRPSLQIGGVLCCPHAATPWLLRELLAAGGGRLLDLQMTPEQTMRALYSIARGETVLHLQLARGNGNS